MVYYFCSTIFKQTQRNSWNRPRRSEDATRWDILEGLLEQNPVLQIFLAGRRVEAPAETQNRSPSGHHWESESSKKWKNSRYKGSVWHHLKIMKNRRCSPQIASSCIIVAFCYIIYPQPKISNTFGAKRPARPNIDGHDPPKPSHLRRRSLAFSTARWTPNTKSLMWKHVKTQGLSQGTSANHYWSCSVSKGPEIKP